MKGYCAVHPPGKNRPLDEEELHFMDAVEQQQRDKDRKAREEEDAELDAFQMVRSSLPAHRTHACKILAMRNTPAQPGWP